jgi:hypothetical protein
MTVSSGKVFPGSRRGGRSEVIDLQFLDVDFAGCLHVSVQDREELDTLSQRVMTTDF